MSYREELETAFEFVTSNQPVDFKAAIFDILTTKANDVIDARKELVAKSVFNSDEE